MPTIRYTVEETTDGNLIFTVGEGEVKYDNHQLGLEYHKFDDAPAGRYYCLRDAAFGSAGSGLTAKSNLGKIVAIYGKIVRVGNHNPFTNSTNYYNHLNCWPTEIEFENGEIRSVVGVRCLEIKKHACDD